MEPPPGTVPLPANVSTTRGGGLFKMDEVTRTVSVETFVVLAALLLVARFLLDFLGPWYRTWSLMVYFVPLFEALNYSMVHYTMGLMQLSSGNVNSYFQVWAVLLTTLQYSVKTGRPYSRSRQIPLLDLMSSFWAANLLRLKTTFLLRTPLWLIWSLNAARIISYFVSSTKQEAINQDSLRLTADYMSYEHGISSTSQHSSAAAAAAAAAADTSSASPGKGLFTMDSYKYLVLGENQVLKDIITHQQEPAQMTKKRKHRIRLDPTVHTKLITLDRIWNVDSGKSGLLLGATEDRSNELKDVCLSFALYKLLRRRFYDLPVHEDRLRTQREKMRRLVFEYILGGDDAERAFRIAGTQLSFLQDLFYSRHAATFADGFPAKHLVLSLLLVVTTGYIAYPVRHIPESMDKAADHNRITHGVLITRIIVALIIGKELAEVYMYIFSRWTIVLMLCSDAKHRCLRNPLIKSVMRVMLFFMTRRDRWDEKICQHNILISARGVNLGFWRPHWSEFPKVIKMEASTKRAILQSIKKLEKNKEMLHSYFTNAFGGHEQPLLLWASRLEADTHTILVWHIATCLCEVAHVPGRKDPKPYSDYRTAASLSNYCAYLVLQALVPDNGLVAQKVWNEVCMEIVDITGCMESCLKQRSMKDVYTRLIRLMPMTSHSLTLTKMGAKLAMQLMEHWMDYEAVLWEKLAVFWTGFLLHLAASTRASKHRTLLAGRRELTTHLWALLSHAGFLGRRTIHGHVAGLDPRERSDFQQANERW